MQEDHRPKVYQVSELTREIQETLEERFNFVWVEGEISNFSAPASGHYYMVLKDNKAQIRTVMFRLQARHLRFVPENGMHVLVQGRVGVYPPRGEYQIILDYLEPMGVGALALAFEQLKKKLAAQGFFDSETKKPLPYLPQRVAVITSPSGAAIRDFLKVIRRRFSNIEITVVPVRVQGDGAETEIANALDLVNERLDVDVIVLTRGGGSLEDLWAYNEEELALAIRRSKIPVVSAVGHEIDTTISDLTADFRAPTPSAAAELLVIEKESLMEYLDDLKTRFVSKINQDIKRYSQELYHFKSRIKDPRKRLDETWMRLDDLTSRMIRLTNFTLQDRKKRLASTAHALFAYSPANRVRTMEQQLAFQATSLGRVMIMRLKDMRSSIWAMEKRITDLSPLSILKRGYSIARKLPEKNILKDTSGLEKGDAVEVILAEGGMNCRVEEVKA